ncbi:29619_t:CDS:1, partial [Racocetra persica]
MSELPFFNVDRIMNNLPFFDVNSHESFMSVDGNNNETSDVYNTKSNEEIVTDNDESDLESDYKEDNNTKSNEEIVINNGEPDLERDHEEDN